jgi:GNAT superfamily N-acetyltransferase
MAGVGVRLARRTDVDAVTRIQVQAWRADLREFVPEAVLAEMADPKARDLWRQHWTEAVTAPPSARHKVLVAVAEDIVAGFAACAPAGDADHDPETTAEIITLRVDPDHKDSGHDSRLLAAAADLLGDDGFSTLITWLFEADETQRAFFVSAGWAPDGARRTLSFPPSDEDSADEDSAGRDPEPVMMVRLHTDISRPQETP